MCVHSEERRDVVLRVLVGGGETSSVVEFALAVDVRVTRFVGDDLAAGDSVKAGGSGKGFGWLRVATIVT